MILSITFCPISIFWPAVPPALSHPRGTTLANADVACFRRGPGWDHAATDLQPRSDRPGHPTPAILPLLLTAPVLEMPIDACMLGSLSAAGRRGCRGCASAKCTQIAAVVDAQTAIAISTATLPDRSAR